MSHRSMIAGLTAAGVALCVSFLVVRGEADARPGGGLVRYVSVGSKREKLDDLGPLLHIQQLEGRVELKSGFSNMTLVMAAYKDGKPVDLPQAEAPDLYEYETNGTIKFAVQIADLDFLPLGGGKKGHCRFRMAFEMPDGATMALENDIPKSVIDLSGFSNVSFTEEASEGNEVPLFWLKTGNEVHINVRTKEEVLAKNKEGAILIVSLRFNDSRKEKK